MVSLVWREMMQHDLDLVHSAMFQEADEAVHSVHVGSPLLTMGAGTTSWEQPSPLQSCS